MKNNKVEVWKNVIIAIEEFRTGFHIAECAAYSLGDCRK